MGKSKHTDKLGHIEPLAYFLPEFCKKFVILKSAFYREVHARRLQMYKRGKRTMIEREEAERWYASLRNIPMLRDGGGGLRSSPLT
jgi:hypothetical protein